MCFFPQKFLDAVIFKVACNWRLVQGNAQRRPWVFLSRLDHHTIIIWVHGWCFLCVRHLMKIWKSPLYLTWPPHPFTIHCHVWYTSYLPFFFFLYPPASHLQEIYRCDGVCWNNRVKYDSMVQYGKYLVSTILHWPSVMPKDRPDLWTCTGEWGGWGGNLIVYKWNMLIKTLRLIKTTISLSPRHLFVFGFFLPLFSTAH